MRVVVHVCLCVPFSCCEPGLLMCVCVCLSAAVSLAYGNVEPELEIVQPKGGAKEGDKIIIRCRIKGLEVMEILRVVRKIGGHDHEVLTNNFVLEAFENTGRYSITNTSNDMENKMRMVELTIDSEYLISLSSQAHTLIITPQMKGIINMSFHRFQSKVLK